MDLTIFFFFFYKCLFCAILRTFLTLFAVYYSIIFGTYALKMYTRGSARGGTSLHRGAITCWDWALRSNPAKESWRTAVKLLLPIPLWAELQRGQRQDRDEWWTFSLFRATFNLSAIVELEWLTEAGMEGVEKRKSLMNGDIFLGGDLSRSVFKKYMFKETVHSTWCSAFFSF